MGAHTFPIDRYYLDYNIKVLIVSGMWNPYKDTRKYWFYSFFSFVVLIMVFFMRVLGELHRMWIGRDNLVNIIRPVIDFISFFAMFLKCINLIVRQSDIADIMNAFNWERRMLCSRKIALNRNNLLSSTMEYSKLLTIIFAVFAIIFTIIVFLCSMDMKNLTIDSLPISATPLKIILKPFNIWTALFYDFVTYFFYISMFFIHDVLFLSLMMNIATQLDILNFRLVNCFRMDIADESFELSEHSTKINFEYREFKEDAQFTPNQELIICIQHYNKIHRMVEVLMKVLQPFLLPQLMMSLLWISLLGFNLFVVILVLLNQLAK